MKRKREEEVISIAKGAEETSSDDDDDDEDLVGSGTIVVPESNNNIKVNNNNNNDNNNDNNDDDDNKITRNRYGSDKSAWTRRRNGLVKKIEDLAIHVGNGAKIVLLIHKDDSKKQEIIASSNIVSVTGKFIEKAHDLIDLFANDAYSSEDIIPRKQNDLRVLFDVLIRQEHRKSAQYKDGAQEFTLTQSDRSTGVRGRRRRKRSDVCERFAVPNKGYSNFAKEEFQECIHAILSSRNHPTTEKELYEWRFDDRVTLPFFKLPTADVLTNSFIQQFVVGKDNGVIQQDLSVVEVEQLHTNVASLLMDSMILLVSLLPNTTYELTQSTECTNTPILMVIINNSTTQENMKELETKCRHTFQQSARFGGCGVAVFRTDVERSAKEVTTYFPELKGTKIIQLNNK